MGVQVKICGITSTEAADAAVQADADYAGLNFHPKSPRNVTLDTAATLASHMRGRVRIVAVTCDARDEELAAIARAVRPDVIQLHGGETPDRTGAIRSRFGIPVMKVLPIADAADFASAAAFADAADMLMFDAKPARGATRTGGHGVAFDWQLMRGRQFAKPWFLAGGLNSENVQRAIRIAEAPGVDTASGVETAPGVKSPELIRAFVAAARSAHYAPGPQS
jgi:phosphoribosylanthranilate isomerase